LKAIHWILIAGLFCFLLAVERVEILRYGVRVSALQQEVALKEARNQYMRFNIAGLSGPDVVYKEAQEKLGLRLTPAKNIVRVDVKDGKNEKQ